MKVHEGDRVLATVITDGMENASEEYSGKTIKALVDRLREKGWTLAYIGANQDCIELQGISVGVPKNDTDFKELLFLGVRDAA